jgi:Fe-S-cluster containining protein
LMKTENNRCVALQGIVGNCVSCSIYLDRPYACRQFKPNGDLCIEARKKLNIKT